MQGSGRSTASGDTQCGVSGAVRDSKLCGCATWTVHGQQEVKLAQRQTPLSGHEDPKGCGEGDGVLLFGDLVLFTSLKILF